MARLPAISDSALDCIIEMAGYGIGYWASKGVIDTDTYTVTEASTGRVAILTRRKIEKAFWAIHDGTVKVGRPGDYISRAVRDADEDGIDAGHIDSDAADVIVQVAMFGEVIYG